MMPAKPMKWRRQRGISLVVVLILLLVVTLLGLAVLRGTLMSERMSANMYDRSLAFQAAESALREAETVVRTAAEAGMTTGVDCTVAGQSCPALPAGAYTDDTAVWSNGTQRQTLASHAPQYLIQYMGRRESTDELSLDSSANSNQYGAGGSVPMEWVYRIYARSHNPSANPDRAVVVLQANVAIK